MDVWSQKMTKHGSRNEQYDLLKFKYILFEDLLFDRRINYLKYLYLIPRISHSIKYKTQ